MAINGQTNGSSTEIRFPYLEPEALYRVSVLAVNRMGTGPPAVVTFDLSTGWYPCGASYSLVVLITHLFASKQLQHKMFYYVPSEIP